MRRTLVLAMLVACGSKMAPSAEVPLPKADESKAYAIHLHRPSHVGARSHVVMDSDEEKTTTTSRGGAVLDTKREKTTVHLDAVSTTLEVNEKRDTTHVVYEVTKLTSNGTALFHGTIDLRRALKESDAKLVANGETPSKDVDTALRSVLSLRTGGPSDDDIFGTVQPQPVGAYWPINTKLAQQDLVSEEGMRSAAVSGQATLASVSHVGDIECIEVRSQLKLSGLEIPNAPEGAIIDSGSITAEFSGMFPIDETLGRVEEHMTFEMTVKLRVPTPSGELTVSVVGISRKDGRFSF